MNILTGSIDYELRRMIKGGPGYDALIKKIYKIEQPPVERNPSACILRLSSDKTSEIIAGKILISSDNKDVVRRYTSRRLRLKSLSESAVRNNKFAPSGVNIGLRPIIKTIDNVIYCGAIADPDHLDSRFEYIWLMHLLQAGESIEDKVKRNVAIIEPLAHAIHDLHHRADKISIDNAWKFGSPAQLQRKLSIDVPLFEQAIANISASLPKEDTSGLWSESLTQQIRQLANKISTDETFRIAFESRIERGKIKKGHGDLKLKNIWFSDYHRNDVIRHFKDCLTFIDAIDFNDMYSVIDTLSEAAMLLTDLQRQVSPVDYSHFVYFYTSQLLDEWSKYDSLVLSYYLMEKALVNSQTALFLDNDYEKAKSSIGILRTNLQNLQRQYDRVQHRQFATNV